MLISGFTFVRNAVKYGYPLIESLQSLLPVCDELIITAGKSEDNTNEVLKSLNEPKLKIIETVWDETAYKNALIYSQQTNLALAECKGDWCIYIQADEVLHEEDYDLILKEIKSTNDNPKIESLLFKYLHFYGSYDYIGTGRQWYRREIRAFRNTGDITSWGDAQGFRKIISGGHCKLNAKQTDIRVFHYGWVRHPKVQFDKINNAEQYYHSEYELKQDSESYFDYNSAYRLEKFKGTHPAVMKHKIESDSIWTQHFNPNNLKKKPFIVSLSDKIEKLCGWRIGEYKDFKIVK
ncbi:MAG: glycosyltransferase [FCB group bacterium]